MKQFNLTDIISVKDETGNVGTAVEADETTEYSQVHVEKFDVSQIHVEKIYDKHGRLSDMIDAAVKLTGLSVIPLDAVGISSNVVFLQRYALIEYGGVKYAMSREVRDDVINEYVSKVREAISEGIVFTEDLTNSFSHCGETYPTYNLSSAELGVLTSKFARYKQRVFLREGSHIFVQIFPEEVSK